MTDTEFYALRWICRCGAGLFLIGFLIGLVA